MTHYLALPGIPLIQETQNVGHMAIVMSISIFPMENATFSDGPICIRWWISDGESPVTKYPW